MIRAVAFLALFLALPLAASASGLIRLTDRDDLFGWEAVGRVELQQNGYCTGVLIAPQLVLTAAHCVYDRQGSLIPAPLIQFRAGLRDGVSIAERRVARIAAAPGYDPHQGMSADNVRNDAALLELDASIPAAVAAPFVIHTAQPGDRVSVVSYGKDRDDALSWQRDCGLLQRGRGLMIFDCDVTFGSSGAPVFARGERRARILSLISGGRFRDGKSIQSYGMDLPSLVDGLKRDLRAMPKAPSQGAKFRRIGQGNNTTGAKFARPGGS